MLELELFSPFDDQQSNFDFGIDDDIGETWGRPYNTESVNGFGDYQEGFIVNDEDENEVAWGIPATEEYLQRELGTARDRLAVFSKPPDISKGLGKRQEKKDIVQLEAFVRQSLQFMIYRDDLCIYDPPCWRRVSKADAICYIRSVLEEYKQTYCLIDRDYHTIYSMLLTNPYIERKREIDTPENKVNFLDGTYDTDLQKLLPHHPADYFFSYINVGYHDIPRCSGSVFETFVQSISAGNPAVREQLLQLVAVLILQYQIKYFFVLLGPSNTGKTQFGRFLEELVGRENVETVRGIQDFSNNWTVGSLEGKMLATCLDLPDAPLPAAAVGIIKQFVGDDPIKGERKYKNSFTFYQKPLLLLAGNHPIRIPRMENERALLNRMIVIPFQNPVEEWDMQQHLYKSLLEEAPYIVGRALEAFEDLKCNHFRVTRTELPPEYQTQDARQEYNTVRQFVDRCCCLKAENQITTEVLWNAYQQFCEDFWLVSTNRTDFSRCLAECLSSHTEVKSLKRIYGKEQRGYSGVTLREI